MATSLDPQLALDERALNHPELEAALERHLRARDDVAEARGVVKVEKKRIDALLDASVTSSLTPPCASAGSGSRSATSRAATASSTRRHAIRSRSAWSTPMATPPGARPPAGARASPFRSAMTRTCGRPARSTPTRSAARPRARSETTTRPRRSDRTDADPVPTPRGLAAQADRSPSTGAVQDELSADARPARARGRALGGRDITMGVGLDEYDIRQDGQPRANARARIHPGVEISFDSRDHGRQTFATDEYDDWQDNVRAIALSLEALRAVERWGVSKGRQYTGLRPPAAGPGSRGAGSPPGRSAGGRSRRRSGTPTLTRATPT
jgi:hypothetical protein